MGPIGCPEMSVRSYHSALPRIPEERRTYAQDTGECPVSRYRLDVSSSTRITTYQSLRIQLVQNAADDGPMRSETCRANISTE